MMKSRTPTVIAILVIFIVVVIVAPSGILWWIWVDMPNSTSNLPECAAQVGSDKARCVDSYNMLIKQIRGDYQAWSMENRATAFVWQQLSTIASFLIVSALIFSGIGLAIYEFRKGTSGNSTLKFGSDGIEVSSEIIGIIVLTLSLGFSYIYIDRLYPISEVGQNISNSEKATTGAENSSSE